MKRFVFFALLLAVAFASCKKDKVTSDTNTQGGGTTTATQLDLMRDTVASYAKEEYLWYDAIPTSFNPRSYTGSNDLAALQSEVDAISQFKINPSTSKPYEYNASYPGESKYSYVDGGQAATSIGGTGGDLGFSVFYQAYNDLRVKYVQPNSSAATAGLVRGYKITAVNSSSNIYYNPNGDPNTDANLQYVVNALGGNTIKLTLQKPDGSSFTVDVAKSTYTINPVFKYTTVSTASNKVVGYFAFSRFTTKTNAQAKIDEAFNYFASKNITELVVDLRYNGGGAVETSEYLANLIVPSSKTGSVMYTETFNNRMQNDDMPFLKKKYNVPAGYFNLANNTYKFAKVGALNLSRVFFLVTGGTASASELLINNLKPTMNVQVIGQTSYGKPVGFFGLPIGNKSQYDLYLAMFESRNSEGKADFYQGMVPGSAYFPGKVVSDDITKDFGDPTEAYFATALNFIEKGTYTTTSFKTLDITPETSSKLKEANSKFDAHEFNGLIDNRLQRRIRN